MRPPRPWPSASPQTRCASGATRRRPAGRPRRQTIVPGTHYVSSCLECHDPHTGIANRPPVVLHPLENLPPCLTCHGPDGFKARNQRHPAGTEDDNRCLECHAAGRGPTADDAGAEPAAAGLRGEPMSEPQDPIAVPAPDPVATAAARGRRPRSPPTRGPAEAAAEPAAEPGRGRAPQPAAGGAGPRRSPAEAEPAARRGGAGRGDPRPARGARSRDHGGVPLTSRFLGFGLALAGGVAGAAALARFTPVFAEETPDATPIVPSYDPAGKQWTFVVDTSSCIGCGLCVVACKEENHVPEVAEYTRTWIERHVITADGELHIDSPDGGIDGFPPDSTAPGVAGKAIEASYFQPRLCMQCANSPCTAVCPVGATYKTEDGVILVDARRCIGCGYCVVACPYGARYLVPAGEDAPNDTPGVADKCTWCYHRITKGRKPACVEVCPVGARQFGDASDPAARSRPSCASGRPSRSAPSGAPSRGCSTSAR